MLRFLDNIRNGTVDPRCLIYAETTKRCHSMELSKSRDVEQVHCSGVNTLDIECIEGRYMLSASANGTIAIHDLDNLTGSVEHTCKSIHKIDRHSRGCHKISVESVQWYPLDTGMFTSSDLEGILKIWDTNTLKCVTEFKLLKRIYQHHMSPIATKHNLIAVARTTSQVSLVDIKSGSFSHQLRGHHGTVLCVKWAANDEHVLASGGCDNSLLLWDIRSPNFILHTFHPHFYHHSNTESPKYPRNKSPGKGVNGLTNAHNGRVNGLSFTSDGLTLLSYGTDSNLFAWNLATGVKENVNFGKIENDSRKTIKFDVSRNSNPSIVYVPCKGRLCAYDMQTGNLISKLIGHFNVVNCVTFHPFHPELYSGANDHNILVWNANQYENMNTINSNDYSNQVVNTNDNWSDDD